MTARGRRLVPSLAMMGIALVTLSLGSHVLSAQAPGRDVYHADPLRTLFASAAAGLPQAFPTPSECVAAFGLACYNLQINQAHDVYLAAKAARITVFASSGDGGASDGFPVANASFPASDPLVTSVGGTNLFTTDTGAYVGETVWNDGDPSLCPFGCTNGVFGATGGAPSTRFPAPAFQQPIGSKVRLTSDVAYNGSVYTGVLVYIGFLDSSQNGWYFVGGTSAGAPQWAAITAIVNQANGASQGYLNPALYAIAANPAKYAQAFHDVTIGNNAFFGPGFAARPGYDLPTGLGSPNVAGLIAALK